MVWLSLFVIADYHSLSTLISMPRQQVWRQPDWRCSKTLTGHSGCVLGLTVNPTLNRLYSCSR